MRASCRSSLLVVVTIASWTDCSVSAGMTACDSEVYCGGDLLREVQTSLVFNDSKEFVDMPMKADPEVVLAAFDNWTNRTRTGLYQFLEEWFFPAGSDLLGWIPTDWQENPPFLDDIEDKDFKAWASSLNRLWTEFGKQVSPTVRENPSRHTLLPVPNPFIVPGGRFREFYYWDSYWIVRGLLLCGMETTVKGMISNMAHLIDRYGFVPNGGRLYYTHRSQPPLLPWILSAYFERTGNISFVEEILPYLDREYQHWMTNRSVYVEECNCTANHYNTSMTSPRPESFKEDYSLASDLPDSDKPRLYSELASAAESGWDFSSRWFRSEGPHSGTLLSIRTSNVVPVDLNAILGINEYILYQLHSAIGSEVMADGYLSSWTIRQSNFDLLFWNEANQLWQDRDLETGELIPRFYVSSLVPLFMMRATNSVDITRHRAVLDKLTAMKVLSCPGGIPTSLDSASNQQWDYPNAWAPMQWFVVAAWVDIGDPVLEEAAEGVATRWLRSTYEAWRLYNQSMFEKYDCTRIGDPGRGGEYIVQSGFGWTNSVVLDFLSMYPRAASTIATPTSFRTTPTSVRTVPTSLGTTPRSSTKFLFLLLLLLLILPVGVVVLCVVCCVYIYRTGKRKYWARIHNEQMLHSNANESRSRSPAVFENANTVSNRNSNVSEITYLSYDTNGGDITLHRYDI